MIQSGNIVRWVLTFVLSVALAQFHTALWIAISDEHHTLAGLLASQAALLLVDVVVWAVVWVMDWY